MKINFKFFVIINHVLLQEEFIIHFYDCVCIYLSIYVTIHTMVGVWGSEVNSRSRFSPVTFRNLTIALNSSKPWPRASSYWASPPTQTHKRRTMNSFHYINHILQGDIYVGKIFSFHNIHTYIHMCIYGYIFYRIIPYMRNMHIFSHYFNERERKERERGGNTSYWLLNPFHFSGKFFFFSNYMKTL